VEVSTDNTNWTLAADKTANISTDQTQSDDFSAAVRYVRKAFRLEPPIPIVVGILGSDWKVLRIL
jgi:hypothetical protein